MNTLNFPNSVIALKQKLASVQATSQFYKPDRAGLGWLYETFYNLIVLLTTANHPDSELSSNLYFFKCFWSPYPCVNPVFEHGEVSISMVRIESSCVNWKHFQTAEKNGIASRDQEGISVIVVKPPLKLESNKFKGSSKYRAIWNQPSRGHWRGILEEWY